MATPTTPEAIKAFEASLIHLLANPEVAAEAAALMRESERRFMTLLTEPRHQFVRYDAEIDRVEYEKPNVFYNTRESSSDSRWMVPGT